MASRKNKRRQFQKSNAATAAEQFEERQPAPHPTPRRWKLGLATTATPQDNNTPTRLHASGSRVWQLAVVFKPVNHWHRANGDSPLCVRACL